MERGPWPASVVIYLDRDSPEPILAMASPGLPPLVPLMAGNPRELWVDRLSDDARLESLVVTAVQAADLGTFRAALDKPL